MVQEIERLSPNAEVHPLAEFESLKFLNNDISTSIDRSKTGLGAKRGLPA